MSCGADKKAEEKKEECSGGFFSWLFGGGSSSAGDSKDCPGACGTQGNAALRDHLKECCGLGTLPPLITKCPAVKPAAAGPAAAKADECAFPPVQTDCSAAVTNENRLPATACGDKNKERLKCVMPETDTSMCIPPWICPPMKSAVKTYPAPYGVVILPMSSNKPRISSNNPGRPSPKCGACGSVSAQESIPEPKVANKNCPMVRSRTCDVKPVEGKAELSLWEKIKAFFMGKAGEFEGICPEVNAAAKAKEEGECKCNCLLCKNGKKISSAPTPARETSQKCGCSKGFQDPVQSFGDFKIPPGTEVQRVPPPKTGCEMSQATETKTKAQSLQPNTTCQTPSSSCAPIVAPTAAEIPEEKTVSGVSTEIPAQEWLCCTDEDDDEDTEGPETSLDEVPQSPDQSNEKKDTTGQEVKEIVVAKVDPCPVVTVTQNECKSEESGPAVEKPEAPAENIEVCAPAVTATAPNAEATSQIEVPTKDLLLYTKCNCISCMQERGDCPKYEERQQQQQRIEYKPKPHESLCGRCGEGKGDNDSCPMCRLNNILYSCPTTKPKPLKIDTCEEESAPDQSDEGPCDCENGSDPCNSDIFHVNEETGKPIYEGGMCITRAQFFMWKLNKCNSTLCEEEHLKMLEMRKSRYLGGMGLGESLNFMWARAEVEPK